LSLNFTAEDGHSPITVAILPTTMVVDQAPEPGSLVLCGLGGLCLFGLYPRRILGKPLRGAPGLSGML
jgi:hypothetical protein